MNSIADNLKIIREKVALSGAKFGQRHTARLLAVTKGIPQDKIREAYSAGQTLFGENYVQEALKKMEVLSDCKGLEWHFIGSLQSNKVKYCVPGFSVIQTVDRESLAKVLDARVKKKSIVKYPILVEVNLAGETNKSGVSPVQLTDLLVYISRLDGIKIIGLMTIPPYFEDPEKSRPFFAKLRELKEQLTRKEIDGIDLGELSMGMSNDYHIAIEEGSTIVRVGRAIFGERR